MKERNRPDDLPGGRSSPSRRPAPPGHAIRRALRALLLLTAAPTLLAGNPGPAGAPAGASSGGPDARGGAGAEQTLPGEALSRHIDRDGPAGWRLHLDPSTGEVRGGIRLGPAGECEAARREARRRAAPVDAADIPALRSSGESLELRLAAARADSFLAAEAPHLALSFEGLRADRPRRVGNLLFFEYHQYHEGLPVEGAGLTLASTVEGDPLFFSSAIAGAIDLSETDPRVGPEEARARALARLHADAGAATVVEWGEGTLAVLPCARTGDSPDRLVWRLACRTEHPAGLWRILIDALSGEVLRIDSQVHSLHGGTLPEAPEPAMAAGRISGPEADAGHPRPAAGPAQRIAGTILGLVRYPDPSAEEAALALPHISVALLADTVPVAAGYTDSAGRFDLGEIGGGALQLRTSLSGRYAAIHAGSRTLPPAAWTGEVRDTLLWDASHATSAEREAYLAATRVHDRLRCVHPPEAEQDPFLPLDQPIPLVVDDTGIAPCNAYAYADPLDPWLGFSPGSDACVAPARIASIVSHEYAHLVTLYAYGDDPAPAELREGFADFQAASLADTPYVALNWPEPGSALRDLDHDLTWPLSPECGSDPHCAGLLLAGALWDMRAALIREAPARGEAVLLAETLFDRMRLGRPRSMEVCLWNLLYQDDDDANLLNGTPHLDAIAGSFEGHGIGDFTPALAHEPLRDQIDAGAADSVSVEVRGIYPPRSVKLHHRLDGGPFQAVTLQERAQAQGSGAPTFAGALPGAPAGARIEYYFTAADTRGHAASLPAGAPSNCFAFLVGPDTTAPVIQHRPPSVAAGAQAGVWLIARIADNRDTLVSVRAEAALLRGGTPVQEGTWVLMPKASGSPWHQTRLGLGPLEPGDRVRYAITAVDAPPANNPGRSPAAGGFEVPVVAGWSWDFEEGAGDLLLDGWEQVAAAPDSLFFPAPSGSHALMAQGGATAAAGDTACLTTPPLVLRDWPRARLEFTSLLDGFDSLPAGVVEARENSLGAWLPATAVYETPCLPEPGASGGREWNLVSVPLDGLTGDAVEVRLIWPLASPGRWFVDDLRVVAAPALAPPEGLSASQGADGRVDLTWQAPAVSGDTPPLGYRLYRALAPGGNEVSLSSDPIPLTSWTDDTSVNGLTYYYGVSALYAAGESPRAAGASGLPYRARLRIPEAVDRTLDATGQGSDTLAIANEGSGPLAVDFFVADPEDSWRDMAIEIPLGESLPGAFTRIADDPRDDAPAPDLSYCAYRVVSGRLVLRLGFHQPLPDPRSRFTLVLLFDLDHSRATGVRGSGVGGDVLAVLGKAIAGATQQLALGYLLDDSYEYLEPLYGLTLREGLDSLEVAIPLGSLGGVDSFACEIQTILEEGDGTATCKAGYPSGPSALRHLLEAGTRGDCFPDMPEAGWLSLPAVSGTARPGSPFPLVLSYGLGDLGGAISRAKLFMRSNDPERTLAVLPITVRHAPETWVTRLLLEPPAPNPFSATTRLRLQVPPRTRWRLDIVDVTGRAIRSLGKGFSTTAELRELPWDGRRDDGSGAEAGCYFAVARGAGGKSSRRVLLLR